MFVINQIIQNSIKIITSQSPALHRRTFFPWLRPIFNQVDPDRIKLIGPDRSCAEWLLRNGGGVKWCDDSKLYKDYNSLALLKDDVRMCLEVFDATEAAITHHGFQNLNGCSRIKQVILHKCNYLCDKAIPQLSLISKSLVSLQITECNDITDAGVLECKNLKGLQELKLGNLPSVQDKAKVLETLKADLPKCKIDFN